MELLLQLGAMLYRRSDIRAFPKANTVQSTAEARDEHRAGSAPPRDYYAPRRDPQSPEPMTIARRTPPPAMPQPPQPGQPDARVADAFKLIQDVGKGFDQHRQSVDEQRGWMTPEGMTAAVDSYGSRPEVQQQLDHAVQMFVVVRDEAQAEVDRVRAALIPQRDMAAEVRAQRDWARQMRLLDSAGSESQRAAMAQRMVRETTDPAQFATLVEEVQPYLVSHGLPTGWLDDTIAQRVPALAEARADLAKADRALTKTRFNVDQQRHALAKGQRAKQPVPPDK